MRGPRRVDRRLLGVALLAVVATSGGCIIAGDRCSAHEVELDKGGYLVCVCAPGAVAKTNGVGCSVCGPNEEVRDGACVCLTGFVKTADQASCTPSQIGAACSDQLPCPESYPYCVSDSSAPYCSIQNCTANADCPANWTCESGASARFCRKPRTGLGIACTASSDCASFEANYCEPFQSHTCILQGCATHGGVRCPNAWLCCDYSTLIGSPLSTCIAPEQMNATGCPQGGQLVTP